ncbi:hypothetical protein GGS23DRAFT_566717 [Durotheca rogersii]|uniref:uncharacterized protein n=1 Tax=Durotheca rogersii TaxID=419775 RepID=UPI00221F5E79|nr:uncharacterized protein GGS23DRAFT_566717 [Durotheca rogersii]KAI5863391.1 hypothetical protein GGS23DRAFT_566717 [Durotheca rogersii]
MIGYAFLGFLFSSAVIAQSCRGVKAVSCHAEILWRRRTRLYCYRSPFERTFVIGLGLRKDGHGYLPPLRQHLPALDWYQLR